MKEKIKKERRIEEMKGRRGITLIALIITIIVMLILVAVTINVAISGGLFGTAKKAVRKTDLAKLQEDWWVTKYANYNTTTDRTNVSDGTLESVFGDKYEQYNDQFEIRNGELIFTGTNEEVKQYAIELGIDVLSSVPQENCWPLLATIAEAISNHKTITNTTKTATVKVDGTTYNLNVGDTFKVLYDYDGEGETDASKRTVRILGFNHDALSDETAYGERTATGKAGISFEFVDFMTGNYKEMNATDTNAGGWAAMSMRVFLNGENGEIEKLSNSSQIKQVKKQYIQNYYNASSVTTSNDKLWLLSCSEIWDNGYDKGNNEHGYGEAIAKEGEQYKYYADINPTYNLANEFLVKKAPGAGSSYGWWLRTPPFAQGHVNNIFCCVGYSGDCCSPVITNAKGVAPGFSI